MSSSSATNFQAALEKAKAIAAALAATPLETKKEEKKTKSDDLVFNRNTEFDSRYMATPITKSGLDGEELTVPGYLVGFIIGKQGETLKHMETHSGCKINVQQETGDEAKKVIILGSKQAIEVAKSLIYEKLEEGRVKYGDAPVPNLERTEEFPIPENKVGLIIGSKAATLKDLQVLSSAKIYITPDAQAGKGRERMVFITGTDENINKAIRLIEEVLQNGPNSIKNVDLSGITGSSGEKQTFHVDIPAEVIGLLIGKGGETIKSIQQQSNCRVTIDANNNAPVRVVTIVGDPHCVLIARQMVAERTGVEIEPLTVDPYKYNPGTGTYDYNAYYSSGAQMGYYDQTKDPQYAEYYKRLYENAGIDPSDSNAAHKLAIHNYYQYYGQYPPGYDESGRPIEGGPYDPNRMANED
jgi:far upstream element-binding protein